MGPRASCVYIFVAPPPECWTLRLLSLGSGDRADLEEYHWPLALEMRKEENLIGILECHCSVLTQFVVEELNQEQERYVSFHQVIITVNQIIVISRISGIYPVCFELVRESLTVTLMSAPLDGM